MITLTRTAIKVIRGYPKDEDQDNWPVTAIGPDGECRFVWMPKSVVALLEPGEQVDCWVEDNGASYDFIDFMSEDEIETECGT